MTKKNYIAIAKDIKSIKILEFSNPEVHKILTILIEYLIITFGTDNPRFNENKFRAACLL